MKMENSNNERQKEIKNIKLIDLEELEFYLNPGTCTPGASLALLETRAQLKWAYRFIKKNYDDFTKDLELFLEKPGKENFLIFPI